MLWQFSQSWLSSLILTGKRLTKYCIWDVPLGAHHVQVQQYSVPVLQCVRAYIHACCIFVSVVCSALVVLQWTEPVHPTTSRVVPATCVSLTRGCATNRRTVSTVQMNTTAVSINIVSSFTSEVGLNVQWTTNVQTTSQNKDAKTSFVYILIIHENSAFCQENIWNSGVNCVKCRNDMVLQPSWRVSWMSFDVKTRSVSHCVGDVMARMTVGTTLMRTNVVSTAAL